MKKILIINTLYFPDIGGGAELRIKERAEGLKKLGHDVVVLTTTDKSGLSIDYVDSVKIYRAEIKNIYWQFSREPHNILKRLLWHYKDRNNTKMSEYVSKVIDIEKPDVVVCHNLSGWSISVWDIIKQRNLPIIQFLHDYYLLCPSSTMFNEDNPTKERSIISKFFRWGFAKKTNSVDVVVGVSQFIVDKFIGYGYFENSRKIVSYNQRNIDNNKTIVEWDGLRTLNIGFIGTLCNAKGIKILIQAFIKTSINAQLLIAGIGSQNYTSELKKIAENDSRIIFLGFIKPSDFYQQIDLLIIPSLWHDTLPGVAIESCAYNVPMISSNMGGLPEVVHDGINGKLITPTIDNLYAAIMYYYHNVDVLNEQKKKCRETVENIYLNTDKMLRNYSELIETLSIKK